VPKADMEKEGYAYLLDQVDWLFTSIKSFSSRNLS